MPARFCPQCGHEQSAAAKFCTHCGATLIGSAPAPVTRVDAAARGTRRLLLPLGVSVLIVLAVAVAILAYRLTHTPAAPPLTNAPAFVLPPAPPLTNAAAQYVPPAAPLTNAPTTGPGQLPADVAAYVQFLQGIEKQRIALDNTDYSDINAALSQAVSAQNAKSAQATEDDENGGTANPSSQNGNNAAKTTEPLSNYGLKWQSLISNFHSQNPPEPCTLLAKNYYLFLDDDFTGVEKLHIGLLNLLDTTNNGTNGSSGVASLTSDLLQTHTKQDQEGTAADDALSQLCARYNAPKPFSIQPEGASSSLLGP